MAAGPGPVDQAELAAAIAQALVVIAPAWEVGIGLLNCQVVPAVDWPVAAIGPAEVWAEEVSDRAAA